MRCSALAILLALGLAASAQAQAPAPHDHVGGDPTARPERVPVEPFRFTPADLERRARVYATLGDETVTVGDIEDAISRQAPSMRNRYAEQQRLRELADGLVRARLLAREAERRAYGNNAVVQQQVRQALVDRLMTQVIDFAPRDIPAADVAGYFEAHPEEFQRPEMVQALHILVATREQAGEILAAARATDLRGFRTLARDRSIDTETKLSGGNLGYFTRDGLPLGADEDDEAVNAQIVEAAFGLQNSGDLVRRPIEVEGGNFSIVMLRGRRPAQNLTLAQVEMGIRQRLWRARRQDRVDELLLDLRQSLQPEVFAERIDRIELPPAQHLPGLHTSPMGTATTTAESPVEVAEERGGAPSMAPAPTTTAPAPATEARE